jgi:peptide/nickel transport system ATP-binding protein
VALFRQPLHPYTRGLIASVPVVGDATRDLAVIPGNVPNLIDLPVGCRFAPRCATRVAEDIELATVAHPELLPIVAGHEVRCWRYHDGVGGLRDEGMRVVAVASAGPAPTASDAA